MSRQKLRRGLRAIVVFGAVAVLLGGGPAAGAEVEGPCTVSFNGVEADRVDGLNSPLELDDGDVLTFHGNDETGTQSARVEVVLAMVTVRDGSAVYGPLQHEFSASLDLDEVSPYGVGLYRVRGTTDNCTAEAWVRISGRFPFATLTGLTAGGLALGGFAAQMTAIATRRRRSALIAATAGLVTGVGVAGIGQQFGRLQLSIPSIAIVAAITSVLGALVALLLVPREGPGWWSRRKAARAEKRAIRYQARLEAARLDAERRESEAAAAEESRRSAAEQAAVEAAPIVPDPDPEPEPASHKEVLPTPPADQASIEGPAWCYVLAPVDVFDLADHTQVIASLQPGNWYLAKRQVGGWVQVAVGDGTEGWVAQSAIHKHG